MSSQNRDTFLQSHMNQDLLCAVNFLGISFYENTKRDRPIQRVSFEDILYVMGSGDTLKLGFIAKDQLRTYEARVELYTCFGLRARCLAEDVLAYCALRLAESTRNESIEVVRRNIINVFEEVEDPYDDDNCSPNRSNNSTFRKQSNIYAIKKIGGSDFQTEADYFAGGLERQNMNEAY